MSMDDTLHIGGALRLASEIEQRNKEDFAAHRALIERIEREMDNMHAQYQSNRQGGDNGERKELD